MNLLPWRNADADTKHDVWLMLIVHGLLFFAALFVFVVYEFLAIFFALGTGRTPYFISLQKDILHWLGPWAYLLLLSPIVLGWVDAYGYVELRSRYGKKTAFLWATVGFTVLLSLFAIASVAAVLGINE